MWRIVSGASVPLIKWCLQHVKFTTKTNQITTVLSRSFLEYLQKKETYSTQTTYDNIGWRSSESVASDQCGQCKVQIPASTPYSVSVEFVVDSLPCSEVFLRILRFSLFEKKTNIPNSNSTRLRRILSNCIRPNVSVLVNFRHEKLPPSRWTVAKQ